MCGGRVEVSGLGDRSLQGDARFAELLGAMGCEVERRRRRTSVVSARRGAPLKGIDVDLADASDLVPTLAAVALFADDADHDRRGRIHPQQGERPARRSGRRARRAGGDVEETDDGLVVRSLGASGCTPPDWRPITTTGWRWRSEWSARAVAGIEVADPDVVIKSWPGFWHMLDGLRR